MFQPKEKVSFHKTAPKRNDTPCFYRFSRFFGGVVPHFCPNSPRHIPFAPHVAPHVAISNASAVSCC